MGTQTGLVWFKLGPGSLRLNLRATKGGVPRRSRSDRGRDIVFLLDRGVDPRWTGARKDAGLTSQADRDAQGSQYL
jgi:hypothetical protein